MKRGTEHMSLNVDNHPDNTPQTKPLKGQIGTKIPKISLADEKDKTADTQTLSDKIEKLKNDIREIDDKAIKELIRIMMDENRTVLKSKIMELENEIIYLKSHTWYNLEDEKSIKEQERKDIREAVQKILERIDEGIDEHLKENLEEFESRKKTLLNLKFKKVIDGLIVGLAENHKKIIKSLVGEDLI